jgi:hypothetical protein
MRFREHRGSYDESMATQVWLANKEELIGYIKAQLGKYGLSFDHKKMSISRYHDGKDPRNDWDTHIVVLANYGVLGFTDGPI